jgi:methyl-accepting chemotaxis protein
LGVGFYLKICLFTPLKNMLMRHKLTLQQKILFIVIGFSLLIFAATIGYISIHSRNVSIATANALMSTTANKFASDIHALLEEDLVATRTLASTVKSFRKMPMDQRQALLKNIYYNILETNPEFLAVWDSWEMNRLDSSYNLSYGRYVNEFWRVGQKIESNFSTKSIVGDPVEYARIKQNKRESIENPYFYSYTGNDNDQQLMTSIIVPIMVDNTFWGVVGVDIPLERYRTIINQIKPFDKSYSMLISHDLKYIGHPSKELLGESVLSDYERLFDSYSITEKIVNGEEAAFQDKDFNEGLSYFTFSPIIVGETQLPWSLAIVVPKSTITKQANRTLFISLLVGFLGLIALSLISYYALKRVFNPVITITQNLKRLALGHVSDDLKLSFNSNDEVGEMAASLNTSIDGLVHKVDFALTIGRGNLNSSFQLLSSEDLLGKALLDMRESLKHSQEDEDKRKREDKKREWTNEGLALFAEILRQNNDSIEKLSKTIIRELVNTLSANQGGLFLLSDDEHEEQHFELSAAFAYNRHKYRQKTILYGEGLIGACAVEKKTIYLTEIPEGYIEITSGLGAATPNSLLIVPLKIEEKVLGVIELATFGSFEDFQIDFVERIAQSIALTLTSVRVNIKTSQLLAKTQQQAEEMQAQEEEMRQNMEELQATQEESTRKSAEMQSFIDALNISSFVIEYDPMGFITAINNAYLELLGLSRDEVVGLHHSDKMEMNPAEKKDYEQFWIDLRNGIPRKQTNRFVVNGKTFVFQETYTPIKNDLGEVYKVLKISNNITNLVASQ